MTLEQHNERLILEKAQHQEISRARLGLLGALALVYGTDDEDGSKVLYLTKDRMEALSGHYVDVRHDDGVYKIIVTPGERDES